MGGGQGYISELSTESLSNLAGGNNATSEFNPDGFFQDMQKGGFSFESNKNKPRKMGKVEKYLSTDIDDDMSDEEFSEMTEGLDVDPNEDTEDLKQKVRALRAMVSRSKASAPVSKRTFKRSSKRSSKKSSRRSSRRSSKKSSRRSSKRMTESSVGGSENSISEYLNSTSSISTSDVRLISMNKIRR